MVEAVRVGSSQRAAARQFGVSLATVQLWLNRAADGPLEQVDWSAQSPVPRHVRRTGPDIEDRIIDLRRVLREESILGEYGPGASRIWAVHFRPSGRLPGSSNGGVPSMPPGGSVDPLHRRAGTSPRSVAGSSSWTASMSSPGYACGVASSSTS